MVANSQIKDWLLVPKPHKAVRDDTQRNRLWRLSFQEQERDLMKGCQQLKTTIKLVKKLRDSRGMKAIASYHIKTLFLWKLQEVNDKKYWDKKLSVTFREMVEVLYNAILNKNIPYFWNEKNNLIQGVKATLLDEYAKNLKHVLDSIDSNDVDKVVYALLNAQEIEEFKNSDFYKGECSLTGTGAPVIVSRSTSIATSSPSEVDSSSQCEKEQRHDGIVELVKNLIMKVDQLSYKMQQQEDRISILERELKALRPNAPTFLSGYSEQSGSNAVDAQRAAATCSLV